MLVLCQSKQNVMYDNKIYKSVNTYLGSFVKLIRASTELQRLSGGLCIALLFGRKTGREERERKQQQQQFEQQQRRKPNEERGRERETK
jgi:hypothetical protein